jgi:hypothetical protein
MWSGIKNVIMANDMISLITCSTTVIDQLYHDKKVLFWWDDNVCLVIDQLYHDKKVLFWWDDNVCLVIDQLYHDKKVLFWCLLLDRHYHLIKIWLSCHDIAGLLLDRHYHLIKIWLSCQKLYFDEMIMSV